MANVTWVGSPNYTVGRQGAEIDRIVLHWIVGYMSAADAVFKNAARQSSAHEAIEDGEIHKYVKEEDTAWHASNWGINLRSIGIEHSANFDRPPSEATYETSAQEVARLCKHYSIPCDRAHIIKHMEVAPTQCPGNVDVDRIVNRAAQILGGSGVIVQPSVTPAQATGDTEINWVGKVTASGDLNVRSAPNTSAPAGQGNTADGNLHAGDVFDVVGYTVAEDPYGDGRNIWLKTFRGMWVWAGNTDFSLGGDPHPAAAGGTVVVASSTLNVRSGPGTSYSAGQANTPDGCLHAGNVVNYVAEVAGENVSGNNIWYKSIRSNYFWSGGCKK